MHACAGRDKSAHNTHMRAWCLVHGTSPPSVQLNHITSSSRLLCVSASLQLPAVEQLAPVRAACSGTGFTRHRPHSVTQTAHQIWWRLNTALTKARSSNRIDGGAHGAPLPPCVGTSATGTGDRVGGRTFGSAPAPRQRAHACRLQPASSGAVRRRRREPCAASQAARSVQAAARRRRWGRRAEGPPGSLGPPGCQAAP